MSDNTNNTNNTPIDNPGYRAAVVQLICTPRIIPQSVFEDVSRLAQLRIDDDATKTQGRAPLWLLEFWQGLAVGTVPFGYIVLTDLEFKRQALQNAALLGLDVARL